MAFTKVKDIAQRLSRYFGRGPLQRYGARELLVRAGIISPLFYIHMGESVRKYADEVELGLKIEEFQKRLRAKAEEEIPEVMEEHANPLNYPVERDEHLLLVALLVNTWSLGTYGEGALTWKDIRALVLETAFSPWVVQNAYEQYLKRTLLEMKKRQGGAEA